jgi:hypothetical protein
VRRPEFIPVACAIPSVGDYSGAAVDELHGRLMGFESLGRNCAFGLLQRQLAPGRSACYVLRPRARRPC